ncbi:hypothetical protein RRG08_022429 [Elysia crispata]|uniref:Uncharacterized protein n=1 Tax=Elysia crispata TaxID=231223 RepID=A0AAE1D962_9GAST|nr:hypothetical protein RRG08_022429 [Elysia crispata]
MASQRDSIKFSIADFIFLTLMLLGSMAIGLFIAVRGNKKKTKEEYLLGGRHMTAFPVCISLFAAFKTDQCVRRPGSTLQVA